jgi:hypothetical protein
MSKKKSDNTHKDYYDRKLARAEETMRALVKVIAVIVPLLIIVQIADWVIF